MKIAPGFIAAKKSGPTKCRVAGLIARWTVTASGRLLGRIYHESDLLVADSLGAGLLDGLSPAELASVASTFTYEHRRPSPSEQRSAATAGVGGSP